MTTRMEETLLQLQEQGVLLYIATGRPYRVVPHIENVRFDAFLTFKGFYCRTQEEVIFRDPLDPEDVLREMKKEVYHEQPSTISGNLPLSGC